MNDEEEVVVPESEQEQVQEQPEQVESRPQRQRQSLTDVMDDVKDKMDTTGKTIENIGKGEEKVADILDGGEKATKAASNVGSATSSAADAGSKISEGAAKAQKGAAKAEKAAAEATKAGAEATKASATAAKEGGKAVSTAGEAINAAGTAADAEYGAGVGANVAGTAMNVGGKIVEGVSDATIAGAEATKDGAETAKAAADAKIAAADAQIAGAKASQAAAKAGKGAGEAAKKASDKTFADKLRERGKLNQLRGKRIQDAAEKFDSEKITKELEEKLGAFGKILGGIAKVFDPRTIATVFLLLITIGTLLVSYILSPMFFMNLIVGTAADPDRVEKVNNFMAGLGFKDTQEAFYDEVDYLNKHYDEELDYSYIMAALYHVDIYYGSNAEYNINDSIEKVCEYIDTSKDDMKKLCTSFQVGYNLSQYYYKEATTTVGGDGLVYSANKLYRLRDLAKHQFLGQKNPQKIGIIDYIAKVKDELDTDLNKLVDYIPFLFAYVFLQVNPLTKPIADAVFSTLLALSVQDGLAKYANDILGIVKGTETWKSLAIYIEEGKYLPALHEISYLFETLLNRFYNIKIELDEEELICKLKLFLDFHLIPNDLKCDCEDTCDEDDDDCIVCPDIFGGDVVKFINDVVKVKYYKFTYDEDKFEDYLVDEYIRYMPEFHKLIIDEKGNRSDEKIMKLAAEIKITKETFDALYNSEESAQDNGKCVGDINLDLLEQLTPPINMTIGQSIQFSGKNNYGLYKGIMHNGVDLQFDTTKTHEGDPIYSVYNGTVAESTLDGTYSDESAKGGWLAIDYNVKYEDSSYGDSKVSKILKKRNSRIRMFYGGLNPSSIKLKKGDTVEKGEIIGTAGSAAMSENGDIASVHIGVFDNTKEVFLNPVNMFITCNKKGKDTNGNGTSGGSSGATCDVSIHDAPSKEDFISATQAYIESGGTFASNLSEWDLEEVYEDSRDVDINVNPELLVAFACKEGFSPGAYANNYWGIGCANLSGRCDHFDSMLHGMLAFANIVRNYESLEDFGKKGYGYLGNYWYNPGDSGEIGGCYYFDSLKKYLSDSRIAEVEPFCSSDNECIPDQDEDDEKKCLKTNDEDLAAHAALNTDIVCQYYNTIYGGIH